MSKERRRFSAQEKQRVALEAVRGEHTLAKIAAKYQVHATQINKWKKELLDHIRTAFVSKPDLIKEDQENLVKTLYEQIGQLKVENDFLKKNLICSIVNRHDLLEPSHPALSVRQQCQLLEINRSSIYYRAQPPDQETLDLLRRVDEIYTAYPFFGTRKMCDYLNLNGAYLGRKKMRGIYEKLGIRSVAPGPHTSKQQPEHKIYPYLLRGKSITHKDHVWSTDITYMRMKKGFCYLIAIIDWFSRFVLDWDISISLEADFCINTLARVLKNGKCDIFNTDQGAQLIMCLLSDCGEVLNMNLVIYKNGAPFLI